MFIDPSMGGQIYNPWRVQDPILQRFGEMNPANDLQQKKKDSSNSTGYRFFGGGGSNMQQGSHEGLRVFRSFF